MTNREGNLDFQLRDYRHQRGSFDKIVSVGMLEHVGPRNFKTYFGTIKRLLAPKGVAVIHTIGVNDNPAPVNRWQGKYIFPGGYIPSFQQMVAAITQHHIQILDVEVMRLHYAETLRDWRLRFIQNIDMGRAIYDDRFIRMWKFYLVGCEYFFRCQHGMVFQFQIAHDQTAAPVNRRYITELQDKFWEKLCQANNSGNIKRSVR